MQLELLGIKILRGYKGGRITKRRLDLEDEIQDFLYFWHRPIRIGDLRKELRKRKLEIPHSTLNSIIQRMEGESLVCWEKYGLVQLTELGKHKMTHKKRHYHLLVMFLMKTLNLSHEKAQKESHSLSAIISCDLINQINQVLNFPNTCLCNEEIPRVDDCVVEEQ